MQSAQTPNASLQNEGEENSNDAFTASAGSSAEQLTKKGTFSIADSGLICIYHEKSKRYVTFMREDIRYIQKDDNYVDFHLISRPGQHFSVRSTLKDVVEYLNDERFLRLSRSLYMNKFQIRHFEEERVYYGDGKRDFVEASKDSLAKLRQMKPGGKSDRSEAAKILTIIRWAIGFHNPALAFFASLIINPFAKANMRSYNGGMAMVN